MFSIYINGNEKKKLSKFNFGKIVCLAFKGLSLKNEMIKGMERTIIT
jgi:hypothetical protein